MKIIFTILAIFTLVSSGISQGKNKHHPKKEEVQAQKVAFISNELSLTKKQAEEFWPIFNAYEAKMETIHMQHRKHVKMLNNFNELTEEEAYTTTEKLIELDEQRTAVKKEYLIQFSEILGKKKGAKVFYLEERFKRELLRIIRKDGGKMPPHPRH
jgi:Spy/CpxP family protein refolding chaperone